MKINHWNRPKKYRGRIEKIAIRQWNGRREGDSKHDNTPAKQSLERIAYSIANVPFKGKLRS
jgi:hypothetical protein